MTDGTARSRGFTLIELLVVMLIIGVITSLATIALSDDRADRVEREARRLAAVMELAAEGAVLQGRTIGLRLEPHGYAFMRQTAEGGWERIEDDREFRPYELPDDIALRFETEGELPAREEGLRPHTAFLASSDVLPIEVTVYHPEVDISYRIAMDYFGRMSFDAQE